MVSRFAPYSPPMEPAEGSTPRWARRPRVGMLVAGGALSLAPGYLAAETYGKSGLTAACLGYVALAVFFAGLLGFAAFQPADDSQRPVLERPMPVARIVGIYLFASTAFAVLHKWLMGGDESWVAATVGGAVFGLSMVWPAVRATRRARRRPLF